MQMDQISQLEWDIPDLSRRIPLYVGLKQTKTNKTIETTNTYAIGNGKSIIILSSWSRGARSLRFHVLVAIRTNIISANDS